MEDLRIKEEKAMEEKAEKDLGGGYKNVNIKRKRKKTLRKKKKKTLRKKKKKQRKRGKGKTRRIR